MRKTSLACDLGQRRLVKIERGAACMRKYSNDDVDVIFAPPLRCLIQFACVFESFTVSLLIVTVPCLSVQSATECLAACSSVIANAMQKCCRPLKVPDVH